MSYKDQKLAWLARHPRATTDEAYEAGYLQCIDNYCNKETFTKKQKQCSHQKTGNTTTRRTDMPGASGSTTTTATAIQALTSSRIATPERKQPQK